MSKSLAISLLQKGTNGDEILQILETLSSGMDDNNDPADGPTLNTIEF